MTDDNGCAWIWFIPPGGFGTVMEIGRVGYSCAHTPAATTASESALRSFLAMFFPPRFWCPAVARRGPVNPVETLAHTGGVGKARHGAVQPMRSASSLKSVTTRSG